ncbi:Ankyrin repeat domain-containing protein [Thalictrum thalictroides]|uniref:Ankyrin repeat domain-containing protein n=1 Tax=Thalictrum thalictroides TaxID=46969 RepID=A0A7J6VVW7_THATH|nr:Ankyrin repeat domain-containing protein [Thalictrum thalictroides]
MASRFGTTSKSQQLLEAASTGDLERLKNLAAKLDDGKGLARVIVDIKDPKSGLTALHIAVRNRKLELFKYLVEDLKLDFELKDEKGDTPLHHAALDGYLLGAVYLLDKCGANPNSRNNTDFTPLHHAAAEGHKPILEALLSRGANVNVESDRGTPLSMATGNGHHEVAAMLLNHYADPDKGSEGLFTPLSAAILASSLACVALLIEAGADPNAEACGESPLILAVSCESETEMIKSLLKAGADPNVTNDEGMTPLEIAAVKKNHQHAEILYPVTSPIPTYSDWSIGEIMRYIRSEEASKKINLRAYEILMERKSKGGDAFQKKKYLAATLWYSKALEISPNNPILLSNKSLCWACLKDGDNALSDAKDCLMLAPEWPKAYYRVGAAYTILEKFDQAVDAFSKGLKLAPKDKDLQNAMRGVIESKMKSIKV